MTNGIKWLGHASILITGQKRIMVDPWKLSRSEPADLVLVTHDHFDHCSPEDIERARGPETVVVGPPDVAAKLGRDAKSITPGETLDVAGVTVEAVAAYNVNKQYHPKSNRWLGYVVTVGGERIYIAGDTDHTPEVDTVKADVALLPIGGTYTMTAEEAAAAANTINPRLAIPVHFGDIVGSESDAKKFESLCKCPVKVLRPGEET